MLTFDGCDPGASPWVEKYFHDCVMDDRDAAGFTLGLCSILVWLTAQIPQFLSNVKNQSSEALSIWFLVEWFAGDTLNLLGCLIQGQQLPTTTMLAAYFVLMDVIMLVQYIYYGALQARRKRMRARASRKRHNHRHAHHHNRNDSQQQAASLLQDSDLNPAMGEPFCPERSEGSTLAGDYSLSTSNPNSSTANREATRSNPLLTLTAATAAGVSMVCVAALALRPDTVLPLLGVGRHLLSVPSVRQDPTAIVGTDGFSAGGGNSSTGISVRKSHSASTFKLAAAGAGAALSVIGRSFLQSSGSDSGGGNITGSGACSFLNCDVALVAGTAMGYLSTCFYLASRVSQIRKNLARKSTEGLSPVMFLLTMSANMCTGVSIVLRLRSLEQLKEQMPWMCGTFGTIALDMTLFYQAITLGQEGHEHSHGHAHHHDHQHGQEHGRSHCQGPGHRHVAPSWPQEHDPCDAFRGKLADLEAPLLTPAAAGPEA